MASVSPPTGPEWKWPLGAEADKAGVVSEDMAFFFPCCAGGDAPLRPIVRAG